MKQIRSSIAQLSRQGIGRSSQPTENCHPPFRSVSLPFYPVRTRVLPSPLAGEGLTVLQHAQKGEGVASQKILSKRSPSPHSTSLQHRAALPREGPARGEGKCCTGVLAARLLRKSSGASPTLEVARQTRGINGASRHRDALRPEHALRELP